MWWILFAIRGTNLCTIETQNLLSRYLFDRWRYLPNSFVEIVPGAITLRKVGVEKSGEKADNVECELETFGFYFWTLLILSATWEELKFHEVGFVPVMRKPMVVGLMSTSGGLFSTHIDECDVTC